MKFSVGYQSNELLKKSILGNLGKIAEVYFPWRGFATGRGTVADSSDSARIERDLSDYAAAGLKTNLLLNANCYGGAAQERSFFEKIGATVQYLREKYALASLTTTSPLVAKFLKNNFPEIEVRASVNMEIGTPDGVDYLARYFDAFYVKREYNWDFHRLAEFRARCVGLGKKTYILANSGCLNFCSARTFHDNLVAHQNEISAKDNAYQFSGICHEFLSDKSARASLLRRSNFIRPEDISAFGEFCDGAKLATRTNRNPSAVVEAYCRGRFCGNLWELTEPAHAAHFYPEILENGKIPSDYAERRLRCGKNCRNCGYCDSVQKSASGILNFL